MNDNILFHKERGLTVEITHRSPDAIRQFDEKNKISMDRQVGLLVSTIGDSLIKFLKTSALKIDNVSILNSVPALIKNENGKYAGNVEFTTRVIHGGYNKKLDISVSCADDNFTLPDIAAVGSKLDATESEEAITLASFKKHDEESKKALQELNEGFTKTASATPSASNVLSPVIHVDKTWLPSSLKENDVVSVEGVKYRIVGDAHNKLSASSDGIFWTLRLVNESSPDSDTINII